MRPRSVRQHSENQKAPVLLPDLQAIIRLQTLCHRVKDRLRTIYPKNYPKWTFLDGTLYKRLSGGFNPSEKNTKWFKWTYFHRGEHNQIFQTTTKLPSIVAAWPCFSATILQPSISTLDLTLSILAERDSNPYGKNPVPHPNIFQGIMEIFGWKSIHWKLAASCYYLVVCNCCTSGVMTTSEVVAKGALIRAGQFLIAPGDLQEMAGNLYKFVLNHACTSWR